MVRVAAAAEAAASTTTQTTTMSKDDNTNTIFGNTTTDNDGAIPTAGSIGANEKKDNPQDPEEKTESKQPQERQEEKQTNTTTTPLPTTTATAETETKEEIGTSKIRKSVQFSKTLAEFYPIEPLKMYLKNNRSLLKKVWYTQNDLLIIKEKNVKIVNKLLKKQQQLEDDPTKKNTRDIRDTVFCTYRGLEWYDEYNFNLRLELWMQGCASVLGEQMKQRRLGRKNPKAIAMVYTKKGCTKQSQELATIRGQKDYAVALQCYKSDTKKNTLSTNTPTKKKRLSLYSKRKSTSFAKDGNEELSQLFLEEEVSIAFATAAAAASATEDDTLPAFAATSAAFASSIANSDDDDDDENNTASTPKKRNSILNKVAIGKRKGLSKLWKMLR